MRDYNLRFREKKSTCVQLSDDDVIDTVNKGIYDRYEYHEFAKNRRRKLEELRNLITSLADAEDQEHERFGKSNRGGYNNNKLSDRKPQNSYNRNSGHSRKCHSGETVAALQKGPGKKENAQL